MDPIKITTIGNSVGIVLTKEMLAKLHASKGDLLYPKETSNGIELIPYNEEFGRQMEIADKIMRKYRDVLKKLAE